MSTAPAEDGRRSPDLTKHYKFKLRPFSGSMLAMLFFFVGTFGANDPDGTRYQDAYFATYPGVWRHGDWITLTSHGSVIVHGRSDSTLNRNGVRLGSADIHDVVERLPEITEALVIGAEEPDGGYWMPLFVVPAPGVALDDSLRDRIRQAIRTGVSPRHVPDDILQVPAIPHTRTGKKLEVPVKRLLQGAPAEQVVNPAAVDSPALLDHYARLGADRRSRRNAVPGPSSHDTRGNT
ncbi:hypothetical protein GCM10010193_63870 [Kitasatospora atroaurantiaca]